MRVQPSEILQKIMALYKSFFWGEGGGGWLVSVLVAGFPVLPAVSGLVCCSGLHCIGLARDVGHEVYVGPRTPV